MPPWVADRLRQAPPPEVPVVRHSIPVICFGNPATSTVATLGINPSRAEFLDRRGVELAGENRRFETLTSLGISSMAEAADETIARAYASCINYFERNPYRLWFNRLEDVLTGVNASYWQGSACHLDLVLWATDPVWRELRSPEDTMRQKLLSGDRGFFLRQLREHPIRLLLLNGRSVIQGYEAAVGALKRSDEIIQSGRIAAEIFVGEAEGVRVLGWSANLQSSHGVTIDFRTMLRDLIARTNNEL